MFINQYWRAEVYTQTLEEQGEREIRKLFAGIYASRKSAERAAERKCKRVKGYGFFVHTLGDTRISKYNPFVMVRSK